MIKKDNLESENHSENSWQSQEENNQQDQDINKMSEQLKQALQKITQLEFELIQQKQYYLAFKEKVISLHQIVEIHLHDNEEYKQKLEQLKEFQIERNITQDHNTEKINKSKKLQAFLDDDELLLYTLKSFNEEDAKSNDQWSDDQQRKPKKNNREARRREKYGDVNHHHHNKIPKIQPEILADDKQDKIKQGQKKLKKDDFKLEDRRNPQPNQDNKIKKINFQQTRQSGQINKEAINYSQKSGILQLKNQQGSQKVNEKKVAHHKKDVDIQLKDCRDQQNIREDNIVENENFGGKQTRGGKSVNNERHQSRPKKQKDNFNMLDLRGQNSNERKEKLFKQNKSDKFIEAEIDGIDRDEFNNAQIQFLHVFTKQDAPKAQVDQQDHPGYIIQNDESEGFQQARSEGPRTRGGKVTNTDSRREVTTEVTEKDPGDEFEIDSSGYNQQTDKLESFQQARSSGVRTRGGKVADTDQRRGVTMAVTEQQPKVKVGQDYSQSYNQQSEESESFDQARSNGIRSRGGKNVNAYSQRGETTALTEQGFIGRVESDSQDHIQQNDESESFDQARSSGLRTRGGKITNTETR